MANVLNRNTPARRIESGQLLLVAARGVDLSPIKDRFNVFSKAHERYVHAQEVVDRVEERLCAAQQEVATLDLAQDRTVQSIVGALISEGQSLRNPLVRYLAMTPSQLIRLPHAAEAEAIHKLAAAIRNDKSASKAVSAGAAVADAAAAAVETALANVTKVEREAGEARHARDIAGQPWETAFAGLALAAKSADHDGGTHLYATLFRTPTRPKPKRRKAAHDSTTTPVPQPAAAPSEPNTKAESTETA